MSSQFLTFMLDDSQYAVEVYNVQEVMEYTRITKMPCADPWMEGLISSRGKGISVINLRKKFGLPAKEPDKETRIIVMEMKPSDDSIITFGAIADSVQEVIDIDDSEIEPPPKFGNNIAGKFIFGIGKKNGNFIIILNINQIFSADEIINLSEITKNLGATVSEDEQENN
ncbi:MAG: chemotaxis protein CheW [Treponemataceae bacterium]|nr:chemotaxis protein CheW [Treponemataceae bacterium]